MKVQREKRESGFVKVNFAANENLDILKQLILVKRIN